MQYKTIKTLTHRLPLYKRVPERLFKLSLQKRNKKIRLKNYPLIACVPSDAIGKHIVLDGLFEEELLHCLFTKVFSKENLMHFKQQAVIDGGANIGNHALFFSRYFKEVIAIEPNPTALKLLDTNIFINKAKNIRVIPLGLSNRPAILPFFEDSQNLGGSGFNVKKSVFEVKEPLQPQSLCVEKGDILLEKNQITTPIGLIKLDIEGYELNALKGLEKTIANYQPIILFETHTSEGKMGSKAIFNYLSQLNYSYFYTIERKNVIHSS